jgi:hypothetical protein
VAWEGCLWRAHAAGVGAATTTRHKHQRTFVGSEEARSRVLPVAGWWSQVRWLCVHSPVSQWAKNDAPIRFLVLIRHCVHTTTSQQ